MILRRFQDRTMRAIPPLFVCNYARTPRNSPLAQSRFRPECPPRLRTTSPVVPGRRKLRSPRPPCSPRCGAMRAADHRRREPSSHLRCEIPVGNTVPTVPLGPDERDHERMALDSVAEDLYGLPPDEFTAARDETSKKAPDPALKKAIKSLRKPTVSAHAVNELVREHPDEIDELLDLGAELRSAMTGNKGDVRRLTEQRRDLISSLVAADLPAAVRDDVTATLEAATADPELGAAVRSGRLVKPLRYAGFGAMPDLEDVVATPVPQRPARKKQTTSAKRSMAKKSAVKAAAKPAPDLSALRQKVLDLAGAADDAQRRYDDAVHAAVEARKLLDRAESERAEAHKAAREAHAAAEQARRELGRLERS